MQVLIGFDRIGLEMIFIYCPPLSDLDILHLDDDIIVLNKPEGLLSVPGRLAEHKDCLETRVQAQYPRATTVHRLDGDTSGIMVMALNIEAHRHISKQFEIKTTQKTYIAIVDGIVEADSGSIDLPLLCDWPNRPLQKVNHEDGRKALTHWRVLDHLDDATRLELTPVTGRSHQLRVHCLSMGHPIVGDRFYATQDGIRKSNRMCLHAHLLTMRHPKTENEMTFCSDVPF